MTTENITPAYVPDNQDAPEGLIPEKTIPTIAVIGNVNQGKTSLIRSILEEDAFGIVADESGSTKISERKRVDLDGEPLFYLIDNPGFELSSALRRKIERADTANQPGAKHFLKILIANIPLLRKLIGGIPNPKLDGELAAWSAVEHYDVLLWVIDVRRNPQSPDFRDTAYLLAKTGKRIIPVFNFLPKPTSRQNDSEDYRQLLHEMLAKENWHNLICEYDTNQRDFRNEIDLLTVVSLAFRKYPEGREKIEAYIDRRKEREIQRLNNARLDIRDAILNAACFVLQKNNVQDEDLDNTKSELHAEYVRRITEFEKDVFRKIIRHWNYKDVDAVLDCQFTPLTASQSAHVQSAEWSKPGGVGGALAGAAAGAAIASVVPVVGTAAGAIVGGVVGSLGLAWSFRHSKGKEVLAFADADSLNKLCMRLIDLTNAIRTRSKAVARDNNPVLKDRYNALPFYRLTVDTWTALQKFGSQNRTTELVNPTEYPPRQREQLERIRNQLMQFLQSHIDL